MRVRTGMARASLLLTLVWIVFTWGSSSRSGSGSAAGIWCGGIIFTSLIRGLIVRRDKVKREPMQWALRRSPRQLAVERVTAHLDMCCSLAFCW